MLQGVASLGDAGLEQVPLAGPKTPIRKEGGAKSGALDDKIYPELAEIVKAWPHLKDETRQAIMKLAQSEH